MEQTVSADNRRAFERFNSDMSVWIRALDSQDYILVEIMNISAGGILFMLDFGFAQGITLEVRFELPQNNDLVEAMAIVRHSVQTGESEYQIGIQFSEVRNYTVPVLMAYLEAIFK